MYLNHSETSFYHLLLLNGLHGEENDLDHQHTPDNNVYIFYQKVWKVCRVIVSLRAQEFGEWNGR